MVARGICAVAAAVIVSTLAGCQRPIDPNDVVLSYREVSGHCSDCPGFELEFRGGGVVRFRGLRGCAVPGDHTYRINAAEFEELVKTFHAAHFFAIPREEPRRRRISDAPVITIGYRDSQRVHETEDAGRGDAKLASLGGRLRAAGRIDRYVTPAPELYRDLLKSGWNVNTRGEDGENALFCAVQRGTAEAVKVLLDHGATVSPQTATSAGMRGHIPTLALLLDTARVDVRGPLAAEMLVYAAGRDQAALEYLLGRGIDANAAAGGRSALMSAISGGTLRAAERLLSAGAHADWRDASGQTAAHVAAARSDQSGFIPLLHRHGADLNAQDKAGRTPLMRAAGLCYGWNVRALLDAGADPSQTANDGRLAEVEAALNTSDPKCEAVSRLLKEARQAIRRKDGAPPRMPSWELHLDGCPPAATCSSPTPRS